MARCDITPKSAQAIKRFESVVSAMRETFLTCSDTDGYLQSMQQFVENPFTSSRSVKVSGNGSYFGRVRKALVSRFEHHNDVISPLDYSEWGYDIGETHPSCPLAVKDIETNPLFEDYFLVYIPREINGMLFTAMECISVFGSLINSSSVKSLFRKEPCVLECDDSQWFWVRKKPIKNSFRRPFNEQNDLVPGTELLPTVRTQCIASLLYAKKSGQRLNSECDVRTASIDACGNHIRVGCFGSEGLQIRTYWDDYSRDDLGISSVV